MTAVEAVTAKIAAMPTATAYEIVRTLGVGVLADEYARLVRACAYDVIEAREGLAAVEALVDELAAAGRA